MESGRIWLKQQNIIRDALNRPKLKSSIECPPTLTQDRPNVLESQRIRAELCVSTIVKSVPRIVPAGDPRIYTLVEGTYASATTSVLKDNILGGAPRFAEFITPRPPPNYYFFGSTIQISKGGEPNAPNSVCAPGEIKRVG
jgi:hypothetical protein